MGTLLVPFDIGLEIPDKVPNATENVFRFHTPEMPVVTSAFRIVVTDHPFSIHDVDQRIFEPMRHVGRRRRDLLMEHELGPHVGTLHQQQISVKIPTQ
jgi:hypothetical protein